MPYADNPDRLATHAIEEAIGTNNDLAMGQLGEFRQSAPRFGMALEAPECSLCTVAKTQGCQRILAMDVPKDLEKHLARRRREPNAHRLPILEELVRLAEECIQRWSLACLDLPLATGED